MSAPNRSEQLRVRKSRLDVELALVACPPRTVTVFLADHLANDFNRQEVLDLLEDSGPFLPAVDARTGVRESFHANAVLWISVPSTALDRAPEELFEHRHPVRIELAGGSPVDGELLYSAPDGDARVVDHLNRADRFFRLFRSDRVYLVNKHHVLRVVEPPKD